MPSIDFTPTPHAEAMALIAGKPVVTRTVFDGLLPELRGRAFTVSGIEGANVLQRLRDTIATLPAGENWEDVRKDLIADLDPYLGDAAAERATLLLRTHAFQAFQAANWQVAQADEDTTHLQYLATEDEHVRDSHLALNGLVLPKDDPFWDTHLPPWDWGCRCRVRPMNPDLVEETRADDADRAPENRLVAEGAVAEQLRNGTLMRDGRRYDVTPPSDSGRANAFAWHPDDLTIPLDQLRQRYDPEVFTVFEQWAKANDTGDSGSVWDWLNERPGAIKTPAEQAARKLGVKAKYNDEVQGGRINAVMSSVKDLYGVVPTRVESLPSYMARQFGAQAKHFPAAFDSHKNRIIINTTSPAWKDMAAVARRNHQSKWWSTGSPDHPVIHEFGHLVHFNQDRANYDFLYDAQLPAEAISQIAGKVSRYALNNPLDFVAEVFTGLFDGKNYDADVMRWYGQFKGPLPK